MKIKFDYSVCDYIEDKYGKSRLLFTDINRLMYETKTEDFSNDKEFDFSNYSAKSKYYDDSNKLVVFKMKDETSGAAGFVGLKPEMYSLLVDDSSEHKNAKDVNKNVVAMISHNEYKDDLLNNNCLRHSINSIQIIKSEDMNPQNQ